MRVLIGCEESQTVLEQFLLRGHDAMSCDLKPGKKGLPHYQGDIFDIINEGWDLGIFFPPCTDLTAAGAVYWPIKQANGRQQAAIDFVLRLWDCGIEKIAIENPTGILNSKWKKPNQIINPYQFGDPFKKRTCLWLKGLPELKPTNIVEPKYHWTSNSYHGGLLKDGTRKKSELPAFKAWDNSEQRSKSFTGIATAMAEQWGNLELKQPVQPELFYETL